MTPAFELSQILQNDNIKIVFLNGCSTKGLVKAIFENTKVKAVIATSTPVGDERAKNISLEFYQSFVIDRLPLQDAFTNLLSTTEYSVPCIDIKGFDTTREIGWDTAGKLDDTKEFSWGLFYSDPEIRFCRFTDLASDTLEELAQLKTDRDKAKKKLDGWKALLGNKKPGDDGYDLISQEIADAQKLLKTSADKIDDARKKRESADKNLTDQDKQRDLEYALKRLNYEKQRNSYLLKSNCFGSFAISGDQYSFHDLLCYNFRWENNIGRNDTFTIPVDAALTGFAGFWQKLASELHVEHAGPVKPVDDPSLQKYPEELKAYQQSIVKELLDKYYLERDEDSGNERPTKRDILIKIKIGSTGIPDWTNIITDFWTHVGLHLQNNPPANAGADYSKWHKMVIFLLDEDTTEEKQKLLKEKFDKISLNMPSVFLTLPPISPVSKEELCSWVGDYRLHTVGFDEKDAEDWYEKSQQGKLLKLVSVLKNTTSYNNIEIFQILKEPIKQ